MTCRSRVLFVFNNMINRCNCENVNFRIFITDSNTEKPEQSETQFDTRVEHCRLDLSLNHVNERTKSVKFTSLHIFRRKGKRERERGRLLDLNTFKIKSK